MITKDCCRNTNFITTTWRQSRKSSRRLFRNFVTVFFLFRNAGIENKVVQRFDYDDDAVEWADAVMTAGGNISILNLLWNVFLGDGTFLLAASKIKNRDKPLIGINTDPQGSVKFFCMHIWVFRSEGYMCLMRKLPKEHFRSALQRLLNGDFW